MSKTKMGLLRQSPEKTFEMLVRRQPTAPLIIAAVVKRLAVRPDDFFGTTRHPDTVLARAFCVALCRRLTDMSYPEIARAMGRTNHSTALTAMQRLDQRMRDGECVCIRATDERTVLADLLDELTVVVLKEVSVD